MAHRNDIKLLIESCINRDEEAWSRFMRRFSGLVKWAAADRLRNWGSAVSSEDTEDIAQQVFSEIWEKNKLAEVRNVKTIEAWLAIVAGNCACNFIRSRKRKDPPMLESLLDRKGKIEEVISESPDAGAMLEEAETSAFLDKFIGRLSPAYRTTLILYYFYDKKHREIAELMKMPVGTVSTIIKRVKDTLKDEFYKKF